MPWWRLRQLKPKDGKDVADEAAMEASPEVAAMAAAVGSQKTERTLQMRLRQR